MSKQFTAKTFAWLRQINRGRFAVDLKVAVELTNYFREDDQDGRAFPSHKTIGDAIGLSERTVKRSIERMAANGDLRVIPGKPGRGSSGQYWMIQKTGTIMPVSAPENRHPGPRKPANTSKKTGTATPETLLEPLREPQPGASHRLTLAGEDATDPHSDMNGREAKQGSGLPRKEAKPEKSKPTFDAAELDALEHVQITLDMDGEPATIGAIVARCQQPGEYYWEGIDIDGRLLARAAKAGYFLREGEHLMTPTQAADRSAPMTSEAVGTAVGTSDVIGISRTSGRTGIPVASYDQAQKVQAQIMAERRRSVIGVH